jgi:hypothetical protein
VKRATLRNWFGSSPASTDSGYQACWSGVRGWPRRLRRCATAATPPKESSWSSAFRNYAGPQHFCLFRGFSSAWVPGSVLGSLPSGVRAFSSGSSLASPGFRASFVLRDSGHSKGESPARFDRYRRAVSYYRRSDVRKRSGAVASTSARRPERRSNRPQRSLRRQRRTAQREVGRAVGPAG